MNVCIKKMFIAVIDNVPNVRMVYFNIKVQITYFSKISKAHNLMNLQ